jgi:murein DD-endopeptidase MepM/ murein hydrolase activator NlpD
MSSPSTKNVKHSIKSGETLSGIARQQGITLDALLALNPEIQDPGRIQIGQVIVIPSQATPDSESGEPEVPQSPSTESREGRGEQIQSAAGANAILFEAESLGALDGTAKQDRLPQRGITGVQASEAMAQTDRKRVMQHKAKFEEAARRFSAPPALLAAIASRESRGGAVLDGRGFGDHGRGFGIMQVDIGNPFPVIQDGGPAGQPHINQATQILKDKLQAAKRRFPELSDVEQWQAAVSRYNGGAGLAPPNSDKGTTGGDYMNDVWARAQFYAREEQWSV